MFVIGITGSFGSGKSTVARIFARISGAKIFDADKIAKKAMKNPQIKKRIMKEFGAADSRKIADIVFADRQKLKKLNSIVHPAVVEEAKKVAKSEKRIIIDAPLLIEAGMLGMVDYLVIVKCNVAKSRLKKRFGEDDIRSRLKNQLTLDEKISSAMHARKPLFIIDNSFSLAKTERQVKRVWQAMDKE